MRQEIKLWSLSVLSRAAGMAFRKLDPRVEIRNPVMFMVWIGSLFISVVFIADLFRGAASYIDKILKGAKPGDIPMQQPTRFQTSVNLKTAAALHLEIPPTVLAAADGVIE